VGLACGGSIDIFVKPLDIKFFPSLRMAWTDEETQSVHITVIRGPAMGREVLIHENGTSSGSVGDRWDKKAFELANATLSKGKSQRGEWDEETEVFLELISPPPTLVAVGGVHITVALMLLAKTLGFRTIVIDPRSAWGNVERFPNVDRLIQAWPQEAFQQIRLTRSSAVVMLTHDAKLDDPALKIALNSPAFYVGALGSRVTNAKRGARLLEAGMSESQLSNLHAPIGLDIGAETPEEIALAIMAEVVSAYRKREPRAAAVEADFHPIKG
jgi:xanthine dehydrogenase accessory factor